MLDLHNKFGEAQKASSLLRFLVNIAGTAATKVKLEQEIHIVEKLTIKKLIAKPVYGIYTPSEQRKAGHFLESLTEGHNESDINLLRTIHKIRSTTTIAAEKFDTAKKYQAKNNLAQAIKYYEDVSVFLSSHLDLYSFNISPIRQLMRYIDTVLSKKRHMSNQEFEAYRNSVLEMAQATLPVSSDSLALILLMDSLLQAKFLKLTLEGRNKSKSSWTHSVGNKLHSIISYFK